MSDWRVQKSVNKVLRGFGASKKVKMARGSALTMSNYKKPTIAFLNPKDAEPTGIDSRFPIIDDFDKDLFAVIDKYVGVMTIAEAVGALESAKLDIQLRARGMEND